MDWIAAVHVTITVLATIGAFASAWLTLRLQASQSVMSASLDKMRLEILTARMVDRAADQKAKDETRAEDQKTRDEMRVEAQKAKDEMREWINGSFLRSATAIAEMKILSVRLDSLERSRDSK